MDLAEYRSLVATLEREAARDPGAMRLRVYGLVALGYGYVFLILAAAIGALIGAIVLAIVTKHAAAFGKVIVGLVIVLGLIVQALVVKIEAPTGIRIPRKRAPRLYDRVEKIRQALRAPRPNVILLTDEFNASVSQVSQFGLLSAPRTYLTLGLPLLYALTPEQFDAVLAHEFGHLSGSHPKRGLWVYRIGRTWDQLMTQMEAAKSWGSILFMRFLHWYVPRLNAAGFVMSRRDEYSADADAARVTSAGAIGGALTALALRGRLLEEGIWPQIWSRASEQSDLPDAAWCAVPRLLREGDANPARSEWLGAAITARANESDTHPSLHDRLLALGLVPQEVAAAVSAADGLVGQLGSTAADHYLPELAAERLDALETEWRTAAEVPWRERFFRAEKMRLRIVELDARERGGTALGIDELWEIAAIIAERSGDEAAVPAAERCLALQEAHPPAHFLLGRALIARRDPAGVTHLQRAMALDLYAIPASTEILYGYFDAIGDEAGKAEAVRRIQGHAQMMAEAKAERETIAKADKFTHATLSADDRQSIEEAIRRVPGIRSVIITRKVMRLCPDQPLFVFLIRPPWSATFLRTPRPSLAREFTLATALNLDYTVIVETRQTAWIRRSLRKSGFGLELMGRPLGAVRSGRTGLA